MPAHPRWHDALEETLTLLGEYPREVESGALAALLKVGNRRAQQIMAPCVTRKIGTAHLADRDQLIRHLRRLASGDQAQWEKRRRRQLAAALGQLEAGYRGNPPLLVAAPTVAAKSQRLRNLPAGVRLEPGRITVEFGGAQEALEKLMALAMGIANDFDDFENEVSH